MSSMISFLADLSARKARKFFKKVSEDKRQTPHNSNRFSTSTVDSDGSQDWESSSLHNQKLSYSKSQKIGDPANAVSDVDNEQTFDLDFDNEDLRDDSSPVSEPENLLGGFHEVNDQTQEALFKALRVVEKERNHSSDDSFKQPVNKFRKRIATLLQSNRPSFSEENAPSTFNNYSGSRFERRNKTLLGRKQRKVEGEYSLYLEKRVADLEMENLEVKTLREKINELEWALDAVREDADRVREDAMALLEQM